MHKSFQGYQEEMFFEIYLCENCNTSFPSPIIDATKIYDFIYKNGDKVPGYDRYWTYFNQIKSEKNPLKYLANSEESYWGVREALRKTEKNKKSDLKVLEIGSGLGYLTYAMKEEGYDVLGMDISNEAVENAKTNFGNYFIREDLFEFSKTDTALFDVVVLTEVIEHVEEPLKFIDAISKLIKQNGSIILATPNKSIAPLDIIWDTEAPPIHHWWFSEESIENIARRLDLTCSFIDFQGYYRMKPKGYRLKKIRKNQLRSPVINKKWELFKYDKFKKKSNFKLFYKSLIASMPFLRTSFIKLKRGTNLCSKRGDVLCAVLHKDNC